jgi:hypothetical protein
MSDVLTSLTVSKRKLMTCLSSAVAVLGGAIFLPRTPLAQDVNTAIDVQGIDTSKAAELVQGAGDLLGLMILVSFDGTIKTYPVTSGGKAVQVNDASYYPPSPRNTLGRTDIQIEVFENSPGHVWVKSGGSNICVQT